MFHNFSEKDTVFPLFCLLKLYTQKTCILFSQFCLICQLFIVSPLCSIKLICFSLSLPFFIIKCTHDNEERMKRLKRYQTDDAKKKRVQRKVSRAEEQELR